MRNSRNKKCANCRRSFYPDPRVRKRQKYCRRERCVKESRVASRRRWYQKNRSHYSGWENAFNVTQWRLRNPGYWRRKTQIGRYRIKGELVRAVAECALQDLIDDRFSLVVGLVSHLIQSPLQGEIASELRRLRLLGHGILTQTPGAGSKEQGTGGAN